MPAPRRVLAGAMDKFVFKSQDATECIIGGRRCSELRVDFAVKDAALRVLPGLCSRWKDITHSYRGSRCGTFLRFVVPALQPFGQTRAVAPGSCNRAIAERCTVGSGEITVP